MEYIEVKVENMHCLVCDKPLKSGDEVHTIKNSKKEPTAFIHSKCLLGSGAYNPPETKTITIKNAINFGL